MFSGIEKTCRSNHSIFRPQNYGSPFNDTAEHISGLGLARLDFERCAPDMSAHAIEAWSVRHPALEPDLKRRIDQAARDCGATRNPIL
jgi:hypothetical protein